MSFIKQITIDRDLARSLEMTEAVYWSKYYGYDDGLLCYATIIAGAFAGAVPEVDVLAMNRVIGLGMWQIVKPADIEAIINFYKNAGAKRFFVQLSENVIQDDLPAMLTEAGLTVHNRWSKLMKELNTPIPSVPTELKIKKLTGEPRQREAYGQILFDCFDWDDTRLQAWLTKSIGQSGYRHYLAYEGETPVAAAALHLMGNHASLAFAATLPSYRGMGAQQALIALRMQEAHMAGCEYIFSETAVSTFEQPVQSNKNMLKMGFEEVYQRENWILEL